MPDPSWKAPVAAAAAEAKPAAATGKPAVAATTRTEQRVVRNNVSDAQRHFDLGSAKLKPAAIKELDALVSRVEAKRPYVDIRVNVVGHTCPTGSDRNNFALSGKRADVVKALSRVQRRTCRDHQHDCARWQIAKVPRGQRPELP